MQVQFCAIMVAGEDSHTSGRGTPFIGSFTFHFSINLYNADCRLGLTEHAGWLLSVLQGCSFSLQICRCIVLVFF